MISSNMTNKTLAEYTFESLREKVYVKKLKSLPKRFVQKKMAIAGKKEPISVILIPKIPNIKTLSASASSLASAGEGGGGGGTTATSTLTTQDLKRKYPSYFIHRPIPSINVREMTDPYNNMTRKMFTDCARTDPTISPALRKRNNAFFRNGFHLKLRAKSQRSNLDGHILTTEEMETLSAQYYRQYLDILNQIDAWCKDQHIMLEQKIKSSHFVGVTQGRTLLKHFPPISLLEPGQLPLTLKVISAEEMGNVIIDRMTEEIMAIRIYSVDEENFTVLPDEYVYTFLNDSALTRYERFYGRSDLEPAVQLSRINKHITNVGYAKAFEAAYLPKVITKIPVDGDPLEKQKQLEDHVRYITENGSDVIAIEANENSGAEAFPQAVNHEMITAIRKDLDEIMLGIAGSTKAQISRTENLTRDNATIMEIENERNVKVPDEKAFAAPIETQLLNPLFAHLVGIPIQNMPVEIYLESIPDAENVLSVLDDEGNNSRNNNNNNINDNNNSDNNNKNNLQDRQESLKEDKLEDIKSKNVKQEDSVSNMGASKSTTKKLNKKSTRKSNTKQPIPKIPKKPQKSNI